MASELLADLSRATDSNDNPLPGAIWYFYLTETTTPQAVYADADLQTSLGATVTADSGGKFVAIYFDASKTYRGILKDAGGSTIKDIDPINALDPLLDLASTESGKGAALVAFAPGVSGSTARTVQARLMQTVYPEDFGAVGDGTTNDRTAINNASAYAEANGLSITFQGHKTYYVSDYIYPRNGIVWNGNGATIKGQTQSAGKLGIFSTDAYSEPPANLITHDIIGPTYSLTLNSVSGLSVGDWVLRRMGNNPYDDVEPLIGDVARITDITGSVVTFDRIIPRSIPIITAYTYVASGSYRNGATIAVATERNKSITKLTAVQRCIGTRFHNLNLQCAEHATGVEGGWGLRCCRDVSWIGCSGNLSADGEMGAGLLGLVQFGSELYIDELRLHSNLNSRGQASLGRGMNLSNCHSVRIGRLEFRGLEGCAIMLESGCSKVRIDEIDMEYASATMRSSLSLLSVVQGSSVRFGSISCETDGIVSELVGTGGSAADYHIEGDVRWRGIMPSLLVSGPTFSGILDYRNDAENVITASISGTTMTVTAHNGVGLTPGSYLTAAGVTPGTRILEFGNGGTTGTGSTGTYTVSISQTVSSTSINAGAYAVVDFGSIRTVPFNLTMTRGFYGFYPIPGPITYAWLAGSADLFTGTQLDGVWLGRESANSGNLVAEIGTNYKSFIINESLAPVTSLIYAHVGRSYGGSKKLLQRGLLHVSRLDQAPDIVSGEFVGVLVSHARVISSSWYDAELPTGTVGPVSGLADSQLTRLLN